MLVPSLTIRTRGPSEATLRKSRCLPLPAPTGTHNSQARPSATAQAFLAQPEMRRIAKASVEGRATAAETAEAILKFTGLVDVSTFVPRTDFQVRRTSSWSPLLEWPET